MTPQTRETLDPRQMLRRAEAMSGKLESSRYTRRPATQPAPAATPQPQTSQQRSAR